ncbi:hypothetical protein XELAEV_18007292mg [Xenopus laevis]|uniref:Ig-like domain-containing protein n=1 Tax=Xenopus laevis TaxID=8355 RepID=A0A974E224_XENLA|nr:hypothetical protein XELAEV_18007292mg [Xenopus laevis]
MQYRIYSAAKNLCTATMCKFTIFVIICICAEPVQGDSIEQPAWQWGKKGQENILACNYRSSSSYPCLYWYRQYPNSPLQFILRRPGTSAACTGRKTQGFDRFDGVADSSSTRMTISSLELSDTAVYYCAVVDFHTG